MFRPMRRIKRELNKEQFLPILKNSKRGVFAVNGDEGYPYAVPVDYYYSEEENRIYFHGAKAGHKVDSIKKNDKCCFTVIGPDEKEEGDWAPYVSSVVVFGRAKLLEGADLTEEKVRQLALKYYPTKEAVEEEISKDIKAAQLYAIEIEHMTGKRIHEK